MTVDDYISYVEAEGNAFAAAAEKGSLDVDIRPCEDWDMRALVRHLGLVHLWAAGSIKFPSDDWFDADDIPDMARYWPELGAEWPNDNDLVDWYRRTHQNLLDVLRSTPADHECFYFLPAPTPLTMWSRRQASEIAIHRFDAEDAHGIQTTFDPEFAADMIDEIIMGFASRPYATPKDVTPDSTMLVSPNDTDKRWHLTIHPDRIDGVRVDPHETPAPAKLTLTGSASDVYLALWNRIEPSANQLQGDSSIMDAWAKNNRVGWSGGE